MGQMRQTVKKPLWVVWRAAALQMQSESGDMCGGFGSLAAKVSLRCFPPGSPVGTRGKHRKSRKRTPQADFFDTLTHPSMGQMRLSMPGIQRRLRIAKREVMRCQPGRWLLRDSSLCDGERLKDTAAVANLGLHVGGFHAGLDALTHHALLADPHAHE